MDLNDYRRYTATLAADLEHDPRVLGLVSLGSMAECGRMPDEFSDHDFFVIVHPGEQTWFRKNAAWLPDAASIVLFFAETPHGCKAVYESGHLVEFAIFDPDEIGVARVNDYRVLLDHERIGERMAAVSKVTAAQPAAEERWLVGQFLTNLLVAALRARRGEVISGRSMLASAVRQFAQLVPVRQKPERAAALDNLDPLRRFERAYPQMASELETASRCGVLEAAARLIALYAGSLARPEERAAVETVSKAIARC